MTDFTMTAGRNFPALTLAFLFLAVSPSLFAQEEDDPRYDRIPQWYLEMAKDAPVLPSSVVTIDGYDNFFLGVDFAEGHISENPKLPQQFFTAFNTNGTHHTENGHDWANNIPSFGGNVWGDPVTAYDSLGNLYYENMYGSGTIQGCKVVKSSNNGLTWSSAIVAINGIDKNWIAADQTGGPYSNYVYTTMTGNGGGNFARSTDLGQTFQQTWSFSTQDIPGMMVCVGPDGNVQGGSVYVVTNGGSTTASNYTFYRSTNGGTSFTQQSSQFWAGYVGTFVNNRHSVENMRTRPYPFIAADNSYGPNRGRLYCVYATNDPPGNGNKPDIWCRYSDDYGFTWSSALRVNDDVNPTQHHQFMPAIWCDKETGRLYIQWMDSRDVPTSDSCLIYATYSDNGGVSFMPNQPVSNKKMKINCTSCGGGGTPAYQGDYNSIVSNSKVAMACWGDFRNGNFASYTGYFPDFAMNLSPANVSFSFSDTIWAEVPDTKLYDDIVNFSASIQQPPSGSIQFSYPEGFSLDTLPGSLPVIVTSNNATPGNYTITITGKGQNGTPVHTRTATLTVLPASPPLTDFIADTTTVCAGSGISFTDLTVNGPSSWEWVFTGGDPETATVQNPQNIVYNEPGSYSVTLITSNVAGSDTITKEDYITVNVVPSAPLSADTVVCEDAEIPGLVAEGENVKWYDDDGLTNLIFEGDTLLTGMTDPGEYAYFATQTQNGCESQSLMVTLTINALPEVILQDFTPICSNQPAFMLEGGVPEGGEYSGTGVLDGYFDPAVAGPGIHEVVYMYADENGCTNTDTNNIEVYDSPDTDLGADMDFCEGEPVTLDAGSGYATYLWSDGSTGQTITTAEGGEFWVEVTNEFLCADRDTVMLTLLPLPGETAVVGGPVSVDNFMDPVSTYTAGEATNATSYYWTIDPASAGTMDFTGVSAEVTWDPGFAGTAQLTVMAVNDCGNGIVSGAYTVEVYSSQGIMENPVGKIKVYPNPNNGMFTLEITTNTRKVLNISISNALGDEIYRTDQVTVDGTFTRTINLGKTASGMFMLRVDDGRNTWQQKIFIEN